ncbi:transposase [Streptomyces sp. NBC_01768]|uniref:transposase n=1 Tax=Streptomyces sp. NBC_01768 TaxID=2975938 RepID=UPI003FA3AFC1
MGSKSNRSRRYTEEFKRDAVALVRSSGKTVTEVARGQCRGTAELGQAGLDRPRAGGAERADERRAGRAASAAAAEP